MIRFAASILILSVSILCSVASAVEVLYVAQPQNGQYSLLTYKVDAQSAVATLVGQAVTIGAASIDSLTVSGNHFIYVWNATDVWVYPTDGNGLPNRRASQHLKFGFSYPVYSFVVDPNGKFAYSAYNWTDNQNNVYTDIVLFTIDGSIGKLTNTGKIVGTYGPNPYIVLDNFLFGIHGRRLYTHWTDFGPYTYGIGYYFYPVNQTTGALGKVKDLFYAQTLECGSSCGVAISDPTSAYSGVCCGPGSGSIVVARNSDGQNFGCEYELAFCSDDVAHLNLDPGGKNVFFGDATVNQVYIGHIDFSTSQLIQSSSSIAGTPPLYFSPDSLLVYAMNATDIGIYAFQPKTGTFIANTTLADSGNVSIATATF